MRRWPALGKGAKEALARGERFLLEGGRDAWPIARAMPVAEHIAVELAQVDSVQRVQVSGELRWLELMVGEVRLVAAAADPAPAVRRFAGLPIAAWAQASNRSATLTTHRGLPAGPDAAPLERFALRLISTTGVAGHVAALVARAAERSLRMGSDSMLGPGSAAFSVAEEVEL